MAGSPWRFWSAGTGGFGVGGPRARSSAMPRYGWTGLAVILVAEVLLFGGVPLIGTYFTPIVWTGYILFADGWVFAKRGRSLLTTARRDLPVLIPFSIGSWLIFEAYNLLLKNWYYVDLPLPQPLRLLGFAWAFGTIVPALRVTAGLLEVHGAFGTWGIRPPALSPRTCGRARSRPSGAGSRGGPSAASSGSSGTTGPPPSGITPSPSRRSGRSSRCRWRAASGSGRLPSSA